MKKTTLLLIASILLVGSYSTSAQEAVSPWTVGADFFNRYNWRGTDFGNSPVVQPTIKFAAGGFSLGAWGSYSLSGTNATEADLFAGYSFKTGTSLLFTDYYFPTEPGSTGNYFDYDDSHTFEIGATQAIGKFSISGYYWLNANDDLYFEAAYATKYVNLFVGGGNESYTTDGEFNVCNIGLSATKSIAITEKFSLPLIGKVILNPDKEQIFLVVGFSL
jgi:hypothetical protein